MFHRTRHDTDTLFKSIDSDRMTVSAVLTAPFPDHAGDVIHPHGADWTRHAEWPWIGIEHLRLNKRGGPPVYPDDRDAGAPIIVGFARSTLDREGGDYAVEYRDFTLKGTRMSLPVGTTYFFKDNRLSRQTFFLVRKGLLPAVSLELQAPEGYRPKVLKTRSPLEPHRPAWEFRRWECCGWVHCKKPVNPHARVLKAQRRDQIMRVVTDGRIEGERLVPVLYKALLGDFGTWPHEPSVYDDAVKNSPFRAAGSDRDVPTIRAAKTMLRAIRMIKEQTTNELTTCEHTEGRTRILGVLLELERKGEECQRVIDMIRADMRLDHTTEQG